LAHGVDRPGGGADSPGPSPANPTVARAAVDRALAVRRDIERFQRAWPGLDAKEDLAPAFTWAELERQLSSLSAGPHGALIAAGLIRSVRQWADPKPPEMVLREILCMAGALMNGGPAAARLDDDDR
jgi:hypothetical protein